MTEKTVRKKAVRKHAINRFKWIYICYLVILAIIIVICLINVNSVLNQYEEKHPQRHLEKAVELLLQEAEDGTLWTKEGVPSMEGGRFEKSADVKSDFIKKLSGDIKFSAAKWIDSESCKYDVISDNMTIAEVTLKKKGDAVQKLFIISIQEYELASYIPVSHNYTIELPDGVSINSEIFISVNGTDLTLDMGETKNTGETVFYLNDIYSNPNVIIKDSYGNESIGKLPESINGKIDFDNCFYNLTLPSSLSVTINGEPQTGKAESDGRLNHRIRLAKKADVKIGDLYGNSIDYLGTSSVPLTYYTITATEDMTVTVDNTPVPEAAKSTVENSDYEMLKDYVKNLPKQITYNVVVLKDDAEIKVKDKDGKEISFDKEQKVQNLAVKSEPLDSVPESVASEINVLTVLEDYSLFMSCDKNFASIAKYLIKSSNLYTVIYKYNNSIDRTFINDHTLLNPPFVEEKVSNFVWISDNCFSVDIHFVKRMNVLGKRLDDKMNERCLFVKYDDTNDNKDNPQWKLVGMKEIIENA